MRNFKNLEDLANFFNTEKKCHKYLKSILWQKGGYCPFCGSHQIHEYKSNFKKNRCYSCKQDFSIRKNTIFDDSRLSLHKWFICIYLVNSSKQGISSLELARQVDITQKSAWLVLQRIKGAFVLNGSKALFNNPEEIIETCLNNNQDVGACSVTNKEESIAIGLERKEVNYTSLAV